MHRLRDDATQWRGGAPTEALSNMSLHLPVKLEKKYVSSNDFKCPSPSGTSGSDDIMDPAVKKKIDRCKRKHRSSLSPKDWQRYKWTRVFDKLQVSLAMWEMQLCVCGKAIKLRAFCECGNAPIKCRKCTRASCARTHTRARTHTHTHTALAFDA